MLASFMCRDTISKSSAPSKNDDSRLRCVRMNILLWVLKQINAIHEIEQPAENEDHDELYKPTTP